MKNIRILQNACYSLKESKKYIIKNKTEHLKELHRIVETEALSEGLLEKITFDEKKNKKKIKKLIFLFLLSLIGFILLAPIYSYIESDRVILYFFINLLIYIVDFCFFYPIFRIPYLILYQYNIKKTPFIRSQKGNEMNKKLAGLRNYIKDSVC